MPSKPNKNTQRREKVFSEEELFYLERLLRPFIRLEGNKMIIPSKCVELISSIIEEDPDKKYLFNKVFLKNSGFSKNSIQLKSNRNYVFIMNQEGSCFMNHPDKENKPFKGLVFNTWRFEILPRLFRSLKQNNLSNEVSPFSYKPINITLQNVEIKIEKIVFNC